MDSKEYLSNIGTKGGQARTERKRVATKENVRKAREAKALYRSNPSLRPSKEHKSV